MRQEELSEIHRQWLLTAVVKVAGEEGVGSLTVAAIADRAGVSNRVFRAQFEDCESCLLAAMQHAVARIQEVIGPAYRSETQWQGAIRAGLGGASPSSSNKSRPSGGCASSIHSPEARRSANTAWTCWPGS